MKMDIRKAKGRLIAHTKQIENVGHGLFLVPSESDDNLKYQVILDEGIQNCNCPDYLRRMQPCKHQYAVIDFISHGGKIA